MVPGKPPVPERPTNFNYGRAKAYCTCSRCGWGLFGHFFSRVSFLFSFSLSLEDSPVYTGILSQWATKPKTNNQPLPKISIPHKVVIMYFSFPTININGRILLRSAELLFTATHV